MPPRRLRPLCLLPLLIAIAGGVELSQAIPPPAPGQTARRSAPQKGPLAMPNVQLTIGGPAVNVPVNLTAAAAGTNGPPGTGRLYAVNSAYTNIVTLQNYPTATGGSTTAEHSLVCTNTGTTETFGGLTYVIFSVQALAGATPSVGNYLGQSNDSGGSGTWAFAQFDVVGNPKVQAGGPAVAFTLPNNGASGSPVAGGVNIYDPSGTVVSTSVSYAGTGTVTGGSNGWTITLSDYTGDVTVRAPSGATPGVGYQLVVGESSGFGYGSFDVVGGGPASDLPLDYHQTADFTTSQQPDGTWSVALFWGTGPGRCYPPDLGQYPGIVAHRLYRKTFPQDGAKHTAVFLQAVETEQVVHQGTAASFTDTGILNFHGYTWQLAIVDGAGQEIRSPGGVCFNPGMNIP